MQRLMTPRLALEPETIGRYEAWREMNRNRVDPGHCELSEDDAWLRLLGRQGHWSAFGYGFFFILGRTDGTMIGEVGLQRRQRGLGPEFDPYPEAAWVVAADRRGQGIAREAMAAVQAWLASTRPELDRMVALIAPGNGASMSVATRLGFQRFTEVAYQDKPYLLYERLVGLHG